MILVLALPVLYLILICFFILKWITMPDYPSENKNLSIDGFSILVPVRNEARRISSLLRSFENLDFERRRFEIIFIDDHSNDNSVTILEDWCGQLDNASVIRLTSGQGKKAAIELGVQNARFSVIICTDADCQPGTNWLNAYETVFTKTQAAFVSAPVSLESRSTLTGTFQYFEQTALTAIGGISIAMQTPTMSNGANMGFMKEAFLTVEGYSGNKEIPSGDDQFLLKKMHDNFPGKIQFIKHPDAVVRTRAAADLDQMIGQRVRWAAKWKATGGWLSILAVFIGTTYASLLILMAWSFLTFSGSSALVWILFLIKIVIDSFFVFISGYYKLRAIRWLWWPVIQLLYPFYAAIIIWKSLQGQYLWKGRRYSTVVD